jgi:hypothetical protein
VRPYLKTNKQTNKQINPPKQNKTKNIKKDGGMAQVVESLLSKCKALSSMPSTAKNK